MTEATARRSIRRAVGIVRVSEVGGRSGDSFHSPAIQHQRIQDECTRHGFQLVDVIEELDVSGGKPLARRPFGAVIERVEAGEVQAVVFAYRDRVDRSIAAGSEAIERIEAAGGVLVAGGTVLSHKTHDSWRRATFESFMSEEQRRAMAEKSREAQERAVARGATPWARVQLGYRREKHGSLQVDPDMAPIVQRAFEMRAGGASITEIRAMLAKHGIERSHRGVQAMLGSRVYLGEIHYGKLHNLKAHEPIIERDLWQAVQKMVTPRGPRPTSDRLLARLGVLRCGSCGARMVAMKFPNGKDPEYPIYRCPSTCDCPRHMTISAVIAERVVVEAVKSALADAEGRASAAENARQAAVELATAQGKLDAAMRAFGDLGLDTESVAIEKLAQLTKARDEAQARVDQIGPQASLTINAVDDWERLSLDARRELIRATVESATVGAGRGADRISVRLFS